MARFVRHLGAEEMQCQEACNNKDVPKTHFRRQSGRHGPDLDHIFGRFETVLYATVV